MTRMCARASLRCCLVALCLLCAVPPSADAQAFVPGALVQFNDNGAWSWFQDERAIIDTTTNQLLISSVASGDGAGGAARDGDDDVASYNLATGAISRFTLVDFTYTADDHFPAALLRRPDGRYLAVYCAHQNDSLIRWRVSTNPGDATSWNPEQTLTITSNQGTTYSNVFYLSDTSKVYDFFRGNNYDPHVLSSSDQGGSFSYSGHLLMDPANSSGQRPYLKYASNGTDRVYFITTEAHPRDFNNGVYAGYMATDGHLHQLNGTDVGSLGTNTGTVTSATAFTPLITPNQIINGTARTNAWTTDVALDSGGNPYMLFTSRVAGSTSDHRFYYARWDGTSVTMTELAKAGGFLYSAETDYTGLGALNPNDPNTLYISTKIDPRDGATTTSKYEIYRGFTTDTGQTWTWTPITINSSADNLRPIMPKWDSTHSALIWFQGTYTTYQHFNSAVVGKFYTGSNGLWMNPAGGAWDSGTNWREGRVGEGLSNIADFSTLDYSGDVALTNGSARTLGFLTTGDTNPATTSNLVISGASITLDGGVIAPQINVKSQTTTLDLPLAGTAGLSKLGNGVLVLSAANSYTGPTSVLAGTVVLAHPDAIHDSLNIANDAVVKLSPGLSPAIVLSSLSIDNRGQLDLANNSLVIDYTGPSNALIEAVRGHLLAGRIPGYVHGLLTTIGFGDNAVLGKTTFEGRNVDASSVLMRFTFGGDANLDGVVDVTDLGALATNWQSTQGTWTSGDFNYDGTVDVTDLGILAVNWQAGATGTPVSLQSALQAIGLTSVPEPLNAMTFISLGFMLFTRLR